MAAHRVPECRVLVVEDDRAVASIHCRFVSRQPGFRVVGVAATIGEAHRLIGTQAPDLLLLDLGLRGGPGLSLLRGLRAAGDPVDAIVVSAHSTPVLVRQCMQLGVIDYLVKPFWPARLGDALTAFGVRHRELTSDRPLDQNAIDRVRRGAAHDDAGPSGLRRERLQEVLDLLARNPCSLTAAEVAEAVGIGRVTARRYLEHLVASGRCTVDELSHGPGRPRKAYRLWMSAPVGSVTPALD